MPLSPDQIAAYHRDGFLTMPGVFAADAAALQAECERLTGLKPLIDSNNIRCRWQDHAETGECRFDCFDPVIDISPVCERIARSPLLSDMAEQLYGEPAFLFKDKLIFKPSGAKGYDMHQDFISWEGFPESFLTAIVAIDPSDAASGATEESADNQRDRDEDPEPASTPLVLIKVLTALAGIAIGDPRIDSRVKR
jgi:hypothetical protein